MWPTSIPPPDGERSGSAGARLARQHVAQIGHFGLGQIAAPVHSGEVMLACVGAAHEVGHRRRPMVGDDPHIESYRSEGAARSSDRRLDALATRHRHRFGQPFEPPRFHQIEGVVAAQTDRDQIAVFAFEDQQL